MGNYSVYIIEQQQENGVTPIKIGCTQNLKKRIRNIQSSNPYRLDLVIAVECESREEGRRLEMYIHRMTERTSRRLNGEWFVTRDLNKIVSMAIEEAGENPVFQPQGPKSEGEKQVSASALAKECGLANLAMVSRITGTGYSTLHQWSTTRPRLLEAVILGCGSIKRGDHHGRQERQEA